MSVERDAETARAIESASQVARRILEAVGRQIVGQDNLKRRLVTALLTGGHVLLEGVPGLGKTLSIKALARSVDGTFSRIQFTPDLLPADLIGTEIFRPQDGTFEVRRGPVFANFVLADEINRAPAKVQSALLETMQEHQVTIGTKTFQVPQPFLVLATQNPIEQEGTYPLPEAQLDRFLMKVKISYPTMDEERKMLDLVVGDDKARAENFSPVVNLQELANLRAACEKVYVDARVKKYIIDLVAATRDPAHFRLKLDNLIELGASPRSTISLFLAARAEALLSGQTYVVPQHVKDIAYDVLRHRILPTYEAEAEGLDTEKIIRTILEGVEVP